MNYIDLVRRIQSEIASTVLKPMIADHYSGLAGYEFWMDGDKFCYAPISREEFYRTPQEKPVDVMTVTRQMCE